MAVYARHLVPKGLIRVEAYESEDWLGELRRNPEHKKALAKRHAMEAAAARERERKEEKTLHGGADAYKMAEDFARELDLERQRSPDTVEEQERAPEKSGGMTAEEEAALRREIYEEGQAWQAKVNEVGGRIPTEDEMASMTRDILAGRPAPEDEPAYLRVQREMLKEDIDKIHTKGGIVEIP